MTLNPSMPSIPSYIIDTLLSTVAGLLACSSTVCIGTSERIAGERIAAHCTGYSFVILRPEVLIEVADSLEDIVDRE
jgi:hypothetical protein